MTRDSLHKIVAHHILCVVLAGLTFVCLHTAAQADMTPIPVPKTTIDVGKRIENSDLVLKDFYVPDNAAKQYVLEQIQVEGHVAKRPLLSGKPIALAFLKDFGLVTQGVPTKVILKLKGLTITTMLIPLESGSAGQVIDARNPESGKTIQAMVSADGNLNIGEP